MSALGNSTGQLGRKIAIRTFVKIMVTILLCEAVVMVILHLLFPWDIWGILVDPILLAVMATPLRYQFIIRPIQDVLEEREQAEKVSQAANQELKSEISERKRAEEQLKASEQQLQTVNQQLQASEQQLRAANQQLQANNQQLQAKEEELQKTNYALGERIKELNCLYGLSQLVDRPGMTLERVFQGLVELIPPSWQYPEITAARIIFEDDQFETADFRETAWQQSADIKVRGKKAGSIEVCYLKEKPPMDEGPFLREERDMLNALAEHMGRIVERAKAERSLQTANRFLSEATEKLKDSNRELQDFAYIASHDLREPLRKISSFGGLLKESLGGRLDQDEQENLEFMVDGADRMNQMIEGLLMYSRLTTREVSPEVVDLNEALEQLLQLELAALLEEEAATVEVPQPLPKVWAVPVQMNQLLQNLISNGIKYHREELQPRIVITAKQIAQDTLRIEVQDNGIGIKEEFHGDVFAMFRRLHSRREYEGTGIGLAVCKKIVEKHGGQIGVESKQGQGATFWFTLSLAQQAEQATEQMQNMIQV